MKNFIRKVGFGLGPNDIFPNDPLTWALKQFNEVPKISWTGKIYKEKELRKHYRNCVFNDRKVLRKKYKNNKTLYKVHKDQLRKIQDKNFGSL